MFPFDKEKYLNESYFLDFTFSK